ncbi:MAG: arylesterase [Bryobacteraceae bacterium]
MKLLSVIAGCILIASCGRAPEPREQPSEKPVAAAQPAAPVVDTRPVIVAFGDSLTAGYGADPGQSYPDHLQRELDKLGYAYHVVNLGISGETTSDALARVSDAVAQKPRIVILEFGGNDGLRGLPIPTARANLDQVMARFQAAHVRILLAGITLPPNYGQDYIRPFQTMYHDLAVRYHAPLIPFLLEGVFEHGLFQQDGIHPNAQGYALVAQTVLRYLRPLLGKITQPTPGPTRKPL